MAVDGKLWVIGGFVKDSLSASVIIYDPETDSWTTGVPLPSPRGGCRATVEDTGSIFLLNFTITGAPLRFQDGTWREYQDEQSSRSAWCVECVLLG